MRGAVAAGHGATAAAGARILAEGGNAVDACVAAVFASAVTESPLTSPGAGGFMLVHRARDRSVRIADGFVAGPGLGLRRRRGGDMAVVDVGFGSSTTTTQPFRIGPASCAVPGIVAGLEDAHRRFGRLPWRELLAPAIELARDGVELTRAQAHIHALLDPILRSSDEGRRVYSRADGTRLGVGDRLVLPELAETFAAIGRRGAAALYRGDRARALVATVRDGGGELTLDDLAAYRPIWRKPVRARFRGHDVFSNPPPSSGGLLVVLGLALLDRLPVEEEGSAAALAQLVEVMREQARARSGRFSTELHRGGLAARLLDPAELRRSLVRVRAGLEAPREAAPLGGTTHVSVIDADGNAAAMSSSTGSGSGVVVPGTGIGLNNMLGEADLVGGRAVPVGRRLTSMMAPAVALDRAGTARVVVGSAGSARLRGAILQVLVNTLEHGLDASAAVEAPRLHVDGVQVHCEGGLDHAELDGLAERGYELVRWRRRNLFFGGAAVVETRPDGTLDAAGDPRRGGAGTVLA